MLRRNIYFVLFTYILFTLWSCPWFPRLQEKIESDAPSQSFVFPYYPYTYPYMTSPISKDQDSDNTHIGSACGLYDKWKEKYVTSDGAEGFLRVQWPDENEETNNTVSDCIGYGMLFAVYLDDYYLFDNLWKYAQLYFNDNGLMNRLIAPDGQILDPDGYTYADLDIAASLVFAYKKWGLYETDARTYLNNILTYEVESGTNVLKPTDSSGGSDNTNPSCFATAFIKIFADFTGNTRWLSVRDTCYEILQKAANSVTGLVPDWCDLNGNPGGGPGGATNPEDYYTDACRIPMRIALDYLWYSDYRAKAFCNKIVTFFNNICEGVAKIIVNGYRLDGNIIQRPDTGEDLVFTAPIASAAMTTDLNDFTFDLFKRVKEIKWCWTLAQKSYILTENKYIQKTMQLMNLLILTGNFPNLYSLYNNPISLPDPTPERVYPCPTESPPPACPALPDLSQNPICPGNNLINNGCFTFGFDTEIWDIKTFDDTITPIPTVTPGLFLYIDMDVNDPGHVQFEQEEINLELDKSYILTFYAISQWPDEIMIDIRENGETSDPYISYLGGEVKIDGAPNNEYGYKTIEIGCEWTNHTIEFTNNIDTTSSAILQIIMGLTGGDMYFDFFILKMDD